jgi:hypothetical protein
VVFFSDFFDLDLEESVELSAADSLLGDFSVLASVFLLLLFVDAALLGFSRVVVVALSEAGLLVTLSDAGLLVTLSEAGLLAGPALDGLVAGFTVAAGDCPVGERLGDGLTEPLAEGVIVAAALGAGLALAVMAGVAVALVEAFTFVVVAGAVVVVPLVDVTPTLKLGVTP